MEFFSKSKYGVIHPLNLVLMKNSNCGCKILEQILQQIQFTEQYNDLVLLTAKFNRLIKKFYLNENHSSERLRNLKQTKVYLEYTKKNRSKLTVSEL